MADAAVIDTDVIILLASRPPDVETRRRRECAEETLRSLKGARFVIPAPVVAELSRDGPGSEVVRQKIVQHISRLKVEPLDLRAADFAGAMVRAALKSRPKNKPRGAVKYDALIAAIAHSIGAR